MAGNRGNRPSPWKAEKPPFLPAPPSGAPSSLTPPPPSPLISRAGEKAPCCNPSARCASFLFYLCPGPGSRTGVSAARNFGFHITYSQDGHPRNVSYLETAFSSNEEEVFFPQLSGSQEHAGTDLEAHLGCSDLKGQGVITKDKDLTWKLKMESMCVLS